MSLGYVILGFLSETSLTGYDLKKKISTSDIFYWSASNNQIYRSLVKLHEDDLVTFAVQHQDGKPSRKIYTITEAGLRELHQWLQSLPSLPQFQNELLMQLTWADQIEKSALKKMLTAYEEELLVRVAMLREKAQRAGRTPEQGHASYPEQAMAHFIALHDFELDWVRSLLHDLSGT